MLTPAVSPDINARPLWLQRSQLIYGKQCKLASEVSLRPPQLQRAWLAYGKQHESASMVNTVSINNRYANRWRPRDGPLICTRASHYGVQCMVQCMESWGWGWWYQQMLHGVNKALRWVKQLVTKCILNQFCMTDVHSSYVHLTNVYMHRICLMSYSREGFDAHCPLAGIPHFHHVGGGGEDQRCLGRVSHGSDIIRVTAQRQDVLPSLQVPDLSRAICGKSGN